MLRRIGVRRLFLFTCTLAFRSTSADDAYLSDDGSLVYYDGYGYTTMDQCDPDTAYGSCSATCQSSYYSLPDGYELVDYDADIVTNVVGQYPFGTHLVIFSGGEAYGVSTYNGGGYWGCCYLGTSGSTYKSNVCSGKVLMRTAAGPSPTAVPTLPPTSSPTKVPTTYPTPTPTIPAPTGKTVLVTVSSEVTFQNLNAVRVNAQPGTKAIMKAALSESTKIPTDNFYNLEVEDYTSSTGRRRQLSSQRDLLSHYASYDDYGTPTMDPTAAPTAEPVALATFDVVMDLLSTNYTRSGKLRSSIQDTIEQAVGSGNLTKSVVSLATTAGNDVLTMISSTALIESTWATTEADSVTSAPTALYEHCPPLYMNPNQLAAYMGRVLCSSNERLSGEACAYIEDLKTAAFPSDRCALKKDPEVSY